MRLIDDGQPSGLPVVRLQATGYRPQQGGSNGAYGRNVAPAGAELSLTRMAEPASSPASIEQKPET